MKRLSLDAFKATTITKKATDQLLEHVLGNCHDAHSPDSESSSEDPGPDIDTLAP